MCVVLSNINIKGGIGKTIGNATMAEILAKCGKRVLLVDNDPQCNMTGLFGMMTDEERCTIKDLYMCPQERLPEYARQMVYPTKYENIDMIVSEPGHRDTISYVEQLEDFSRYVFGVPYAVIQEALTREDVMKHGRNACAD